MADDKKTGENIGSHKVRVFNDDRGLAPVSSGTPMPKVKPAAPAKNTTAQAQSNKK